MGKNLNLGYTPSEQEEPGILETGMRMGANAIGTAGKAAIGGAVAAGKWLKYQASPDSGRFGSGGNYPSAAIPPGSTKTAAPELASHTADTPPPPVVDASKGASQVQNPDNNGMGSAISRTSQSGLDYAGGLQKAMGEGNSFNDNNLPYGTGQSVTGITPREAPDPNFWRNQQLMDDAQRASTIRYQTLNSISSMIQDIQNRMGNNYGNRMDQAMTPEQGAKAINNLMSGIGNFGSTGREVEGQQAAMNQAEDINAKKAHFNQLAEDSRLNRAIEMGKLNETSRSNQAREAIDTGKYGMEYDLGNKKVGAENYKTNMNYLSNVAKNDSAARAVVLKNDPKVRENVDNYMAQNSKRIEANYKQLVKDPNYKNMTLDQYRSLIEEDRYKQMVNQQMSVANSNSPDVNMAILPSNQ